MANLERRFRDSWLVHFSLSPDFVEADPDNELLDFEVEHLGELGREAVTDSCGIEACSGRMLSMPMPPRPARHLLPRRAPPRHPWRPASTARRTHLAGGDPAILAMLGRAARLGLVEAPIVIMRSAARPAR